MVNWQAGPPMKPGRTSRLQALGDPLRPSIARSQ